MNWTILKNKYPKSEKEIRLFYNSSKDKNPRTVINMFLNTKGYNCGFTFIHNLKDYENGIHTP